MELRDEVVMGMILPNGKVVLITGVVSGKGSEGECTITIPNSHVHMDADGNIGEDKQPKGSFSGLMMPYSLVNEIPLSERRYKLQKYKLKTYGHLENGIKIYDEIVREFEADEVRIDPQVEVVSVMVKEGSVEIATCGNLSISTDRIVEGKSITFIVTHDQYKEYIK